MKEKPIYITTTLPYVNAKPHVGFALEIVQADAKARFERLMGGEVFFNFGTDEHGQKVLKAAEKEGLSPQEYVNKLAPKFDDLKKALNLSYDKFIRTTNEDHVRAAQALWKICEENGDIYKKKYKGLYCVSCERFIKQDELKNGCCPDHPEKDLEELEEENYFFKFSKYENELLDYLSSEKVILPEWRREEAVKFVKDGLEDFSISRLKEKMSWGVPVPGDDEHVMYVWFDALTNYISTLGWPEDKEGNFEKFWTNGETLQFAGKDQVRFQSLMWQAMLISAGVKNTDQIFYHGFINSGGRKMSKSIGNVVDPIEYIEEFGTDALRYFLLRHIHPVEDSDFTRERFEEIYNGELVNGLGNLVSRVMKMAEDNGVETILHEDSYPEDISKAVRSFNFHESLNSIWSRIQKLDLKITEEEPFKIVKSNPNVGKVIIQELVQGVHEIGIFLEPFMPETAEKIKEAVKINKKPENLFPRK